MSADLKNVLRPLVESLPPYIKSGGSIQEVRKYRKDHAKALKAYNKQRPSESELKDCINLMQPWFSRH